MSIILAFVNCIGCLSYKWQVKTKSPLVASPTEDDVPDGLRIRRLPKGENFFAVENLGREPIFVSYGDSIVEYSGQSVRVVSGDTRHIHDDATSPDTPIAPGTSAVISLFDPLRHVDLVKMGRMARFRIAIHGTNGGIAYAVMQPLGGSRLTETFVTSASSGDKVACALTAIFYGGWCWFVHPRDSNREEALERAQRDYQASDEDLEYIGRE